MPPEIPKQIGRYQVQAELGRGGFGKVYRAYDPTVGRQVAVKVLTAGGHDLLSRFRNEATVAGNLRHKNIVTVYEYGVHEDKPFLAMEFLEGEDLSKVLAAKRPLTLLQKTSIMSQVADGLACAHAGGVVHRDIKPANIMLLPDGSIKIMDFGIARLVADRDATRLTQQGFMLGTLLYMAPEQFAQREIDERCDIFAFGVIYYELLTGKHPFEAPDSQGVMYKISFVDPPPVRSIVPEVPEALERVLSGLLQKDRELRYHNLKDCLYDVEGVRIDLQQAYAEKLLSTATDLFNKGDLGAANHKLHEILSIDPSNRGARTLRETLQKLEHQRTLQPRIDHLIKEGDDHLAQRGYASAIQSFEAAQRLDPNNTQIQGRLEQARGLVEQSGKAARLVATARKELERANVTSAFRSITEALRYDPQNPEAGELLHSIQSAMDRRQQETRVEEAISKAEGLLLLHAYDDAIALLTGVEGAEKFPKVVRLLDWIRGQKKEHDRRERLRSEMARATDLLRQRRFEEAVRCLETLEGDFPGNEEASQLYLYALKELAAQDRLKAIEDMAGKAAARMESGDIDGAIQLLDEGLKKYPGESKLIQALDAAIADKADRQRKQAIADTIDRCRQLRAAKRLSEAVHVAESAAREYSGEVSLNDLLRILQQELEQQKQATAVAKAIEDAEKLLRESEPEKAFALLEQVSARYPGQPRLAALIARAQEEIRALEKAREVDAIARQARAFVQLREFDDAIRVLDSGLHFYPGERALVTQHEEAVAAREAMLREQAVRDVVERTGPLRKENRYSEALYLVATGLHQFPRESALMALQDDISREWDRQRRVEAAQKAAADAHVLIAKGQLEEAIRLLEENRTRYPEAAELETLLGRAREEKKTRERAAAVEQLSTAVHALMANEEFDAAVTKVEQGLRDWPGDAVLVSLLASVRAAKASWLRAEAIGKAVRSASELGEQGRFGEALRVVAAALEKYPGEQPLLALRKRLEADWERQKRADAIAKVQVDAGRLLDQNKLDEALILLREANARYPGERGIESLLARGQELVRARERAEMVAEIARYARSRADARDFDGALQAIDGGLRTYARENSLLRLRETVLAEKAAWQLQQLVARAAQIARERRFAEALDLIGASLRENPGEPSLVEAERQIREDWERHKQELARQREEAIQAVVRQARAQAESGNFDTALQALARGLTTWPGERALLALEESTRAAKAAWEREQALARERAEAIRKICAEAQRLAQARDFDGALSLLDHAQAQYSEEGDLASVRANVIAARQAWVREQEREAERLRILAQDLNDLRQLDEEACRADPAQTSDLLHSARSIAERHPNDEARAQANAVIAHLAAIETTRRELAARNFPSVLQLCRTWLAKYPGHAVFAGLEKEAEQRQKVILIDEAKRRAAAETDLHKRLQMLEDALKTYPGEGGFEDEIRFTRNKLDLVSSIVEEARSHEQAGRLEAALQRWASLATIYKNYPGLAGETARINRKMEEARAGALARWVQQIEPLVAAGDLAAASEMLRRALAEFPGATELAEVSRRLAALKDQKARAQQAYAEGRSACEQGRYQEGAARLRQAVEIDRADPAFRKAVMNTLFQFARTAGTSSWRDAEMLAQSAAAIEPGAPIPEDLSRIIASAKCEEAVSAAVSQANQLKGSGDLRGALNVLEGALAAYPKESRLKTLRDLLATQLKEQRTGLLKELRNMQQAAATMEDLAGLEAFEQRAKAISAQYAGDAEIAALAQETARIVNARTKQLKAARLKASFAAQRKWVVGAAAALAVGFAIWFALHNFWPSSVAVDVTTSPAGAAVKIGTQACAATPCRLQLGPGSYTLEAALDGYAPVSKPLTIAKGAQVPPSAFTLEPLHPAVQIATNFESGTVSLDGGAAQPLHGGQFSLPDIPFGKHRLHVSGSDGEATVSFETAPGRAPVVSGPLQAKKVEAVLLTSLGRTVRLDCNCANEKVSLGGKAMGETQSGGLELRDVPAGAKDLKIGEGDKQRDFVVELRPVPSLSVFINSNRNVGTLVVETGVENATVTIDNKRYGSTTDAGVLRVVIDVDTHKVQVQKDGFETAAPQTVEVRKGTEEKVTFKLVPKDSLLALREGMPGTQVTVDGRPVGSVPASGNLSASIKPGDHRIDLARDGYLPKQILRHVGPGQSLELARADLTLVRDSRPDAEQAAWDRVNKNDQASLRAYLGANAGSRFAADARSRLDQLIKAAEAKAAEAKAAEARAAEAKAAEARAAEAKAAEARAAEARAAEARAAEARAAEAKAAQQKKQFAVDRQAVQTALAQYEQAFNTRSAASLQDIWPKIPKPNLDSVRQIFKDAKSISLKLTLTGEPAFDGDKATVTGQQTTTTVYDQGPQGTTRRFRMELQKVNGRFVIISVTLG